MILIVALFEVNRGLHTEPKNIDEASYINVFQVNGIQNDDFKVKTFTAFEISILIIHRLYSGLVENSLFAS